MSIRLPKATAVALAIAASLVGRSPASADSLEPFMALLNGAQEAPPVPSPSTGVAFLTFNKDNANLCYAISYTPLSSNELVAHFHGPAAPGQTADVVKDISPSPSPFGSPKNGCVELDKQQTKDLRKGLWYINVHTDDHPTGEIRGQVLPVKGIKYKNVPPIESPSGAFVD
jgi:hypothetical protein